MPAAYTCNRCFFPRPRARGDAEMHRYRSMPACLPTCLRACLASCLSESLRSAHPALLSPVHLLKSKPVCIFFYCIHFATCLCPCSLLIHLTPFLVLHVEAELARLVQQRTSSQGLARERATTNATAPSRLPSTRRHRRRPCSAPHALQRSAAAIRCHTQSLPQPCRMTRPA